MKNLINLWADIVGESVQEEAEYGKFVSESEDDDAYEEYVAKMRAEGEKPVSKEEWDKLEKPEIPTYEDYINVLKKANSVRSPSQKIDPFFRDEWDKFNDAEKVEIVTVLNQSGLTGKDRFNRDEYGNIVLPGEDEETEKVKIGKDGETLGTAVQKMMNGDGDEDEDKKAKYHVRRIAVVTDFENPRRNVNQDTLDKFNTEDEANEALAEMMKNDIQKFRLNPDKIFEFTPNELLKADPTALGFRFIGVEGKGQKSVPDGRGGVRRGKSDRGGYDPKDDEDLPYEERDTFEYAIRFLKDVYALLGREITEEEIRNNILSNVRRQEFWYDEGYKRMCTLQYYRYYTANEVRGRGMTKKDVDRAIEKSMKGDPKKVTDQTEDEDENED